MQPVKILLKIVALFSCISALISIRNSGSKSAGNETERDLVFSIDFSLSILRQVWRVAIIFISWGGVTDNWVWKTIFYGPEFPARVLSNSINRPLRKACISRAGLRNSKCFRSNRCSCLPIPAKKSAKCGTAHTNFPEYAHSFPPFDDLFLR